MISLFNKYRPLTFDDVVGQDTTVSILKKAIETGKIAHGYLFIGNRGLGKTTLARIFAKALNCNADVVPCNECESCVAINEDKSMDVIELDAASNRGVDTVRDVIINKVNYKPRSKYKVYIIDEVHMLTTEAFNAMLKTLEQPPEYCVFIFCTTNPEKIPKTIISRVQTFRLKDIDNDDIVGRLKYICKQEGIKATNDALYAIARYSKGGMRDSISALDQLSSFGEKVDSELVSSVLGLVDEDVCCKLFDAIADRNYDECVSVVSDIYDNGKSITDVFDVLCSYIRTYIKIICGCKVNNSDVSDSVMEYLVNLSEKNCIDYHLLIKLFVDGERNLKYSNDKQLVFLGIISKYISGKTPTVEKPQKVAKQKEPDTDDAPVSDIKNRIKQRVESDDNNDEPITMTDAIGKWFKNGSGKRAAKK